jgi:hypothetical protein
MKPRPVRQTIRFPEVQTSRRRLAMSHWHGRNINAHPDARVGEEKNHAGGGGRLALAAIISPSA